MEADKDMDPRVFEYARRNRWLFDGELRLSYLRLCILEQANIKYVPKYVLKAVGIEPYVKSEENGSIK